MKPDSFAYKLAKVIDETQLDMNSVVALLKQDVSSVSELSVTRWLLEDLMYEPTKHYQDMYLKRLQDY